MLFQPPSPIFVQETVLTLNRKTGQVLLKREVTPALSTINDACLDNSRPQFGVKLWRDAPFHFNQKGKCEPHEE